MGSNKVQCWVRHRCGYLVSPLFRVFCLVQGSAATPAADMSLKEEVQVQAQLGEPSASLEEASDALLRAEVQASVAERAETEEEANDVLLRAEVQASVAERARVLEAADGSGFPLSGLGLSSCLQAIPEEGPVPHELGLVRHRAELAKAEAAEATELMAQTGLEAHAASKEEAAFESQGIQGKWQREKQLNELSAQTQHKKAELLRLEAEAEQRSRVASLAQQAAEAAEAWASEGGAGQPGTPEQGTYEARAAAQRSLSLERAYTEECQALKSLLTRHAGERGALESAADTPSVVSCDSWGPAAEGPGMPEWVQVAGADDDFDGQYQLQQWGQCAERPVYKRMRDPASVLDRYLYARFSPYPSMQGCEQGALHEALREGPLPPRIKSPVKLRKAKPSQPGGGPLPVASRVPVRRMETATSMHDLIRKRRLRRSGELAEDGTAPHAGQAEEEEHEECTVSWCLGQRVGAEDCRLSVFDAAQGPHEVWARWRRGLEWVQVELRPCQTPRELPPSPEQAEGDAVRVLDIATLLFMQEDTNDSGYIDGEEIANLTNRLEEQLRRLAEGQHARVLAEHAHLKVQIAPRAKLELDKARQELRSQGPAVQISFEGLVEMLGKEPWAVLVPAVHPGAVRGALALYHEKEVHRRGGAILREVHAMFNYIDTDGGGSLDAKEIGQLVEQMSHDMKAASGSVDPALNPECGPSP